MAPRVRVAQSNIQDQISLMSISLQCVDTVDWPTRRVSGLISRSVWKAPGRTAEWVTNPLVSQHACHVGLQARCRVYHSVWQPLNVNIRWWLLDEIDDVNSWVGAAGNCTQQGLAVRTDEHLVQWAYWQPWTWPLSPRRTTKWRLHPFFLPNGWWLGKQYHLS